MRMQFICDAPKSIVAIWFYYKVMGQNVKNVSRPHLFFVPSAPLLSVPTPAQEETASRDKQGNGRRCDITVHVDVLRYKREKRRDLNRGRSIDLALRRRELLTFYFFGWQSNDKIFL